MGWTMGKEAELKAVINAEVKRAKEAGLASVNISDLAARFTGSFRTVRWKEFKK